MTARDAVREREQAKLRPPVEKPEKPKARKAKPVVDVTVEVTASDVEKPAETWERPEWPE